VRFLPGGENSFNFSFIDLKFFITALTLYLQRKSGLKIGSHLTLQRHMGRWVCLPSLFVTIDKRLNSVNSRGYSPSRSIAKPDINSRSTSSASPQALIILVNSRPYTARDKSTEMNATDCSSEHLCSNSTALYEDYVFIGNLIKVLAIVILLIACPLVILLNALVIVAIKKNRRLQTRSNILLASLAGTDLAMGLTSQPVFIAENISRLASRSLSAYGTLYDITTDILVRVLCLASLFHLVLISADRFVAMKCSLRYHTIMTKFRITVAVACSWLVAVACSIFNKVSPEIRIVPIMTAISLVVIIYCHGSVYFVCRRHLIQIKSVQPSQEVAAKFLEEKKAWKTTGIVMGGVFMCYILGFLSLLLPIISPANKKILDTLLPSTLYGSFIILNSLLNPVIYCWRSKVIRKAILQLLKKSN